MNTLVIGGTSGLGLEIARDFSELGNDVIVSGRHDPNQEGLDFREFDLSKPELPRRIGEFVTNLPDISTLVYAPGFFQEGQITDLSDEQVDEMLDVCGRGLIFFVKKVLEKQSKLNELIVVTSTSERIPRLYEPVYNFAKAGAGLYTSAQALDPAIGKTLKVLVSGMATPFWAKDGRDTSAYLHPDWVADQIMSERPKVKEYRPIDILGPENEKRVIVDEALCR